MAIGDLKTRLRAKFGRRNSTASSISSSHQQQPPQQQQQLEARRWSRSLKSRASQRAPSISGSHIIDNDDDDDDHQSHARGESQNDVRVPQPLFERSGASIAEEDAQVADEGRGRVQLSTLDQDGSDQRHPETPPSQRQSHLQSQSQSQPAAASPLSPVAAESTDTVPVAQPQFLSSTDDRKYHSSSTTTYCPTPTTDVVPIAKEPIELPSPALATDGERIEFQLNSFDVNAPVDRSPITVLPKGDRPSELSRKQSLLPHQQTKLIRTLLETDLPSEAKGAHAEYFSRNGPPTISPNMVSRKIWVKRPNASATLVTIHEDDLVDDVREMILKKYANSLGRNFDAPDVILRILTREQRQERILGPEEPMSRTLDAYFPGGQTVDEALIIDVPVKRTPKLSPHPTHYRYYDDLRPAEAGSDYFPQMPVPVAPSPHLPNAVPVPSLATSHHPALTHSMSVLTTGQVPPLPSPGSATRRHHRDGPRDRPRMTRQHTSSPTVISTHSQGAVLNNEKSAAPPVAPPLPTPPAQQNELIPIPRVATPPPRVSSPRPAPRAKKAKKTAEPPSLPAGMLNGAVPPINVLIVEDNIINLKLLEAFMKRLKVRWQTAMNGREAVTKWRTGGFHLVLMDIQLPIMNGLQATKEIRRLERLNHIGVFSSSASSSAPEQCADEPEGADKLTSPVLFKSPVIIVALTASSLQSDRHEALAAGCNDFLTKPVNFVWLERKVMEWGCMQALIDFDGWRKWKDFSQNGNDDGGGGGGGGGSGPGGGGGGKKTLASSKKKKRQSMGSSTAAASSTTHLSIKEEDEKQAS